MSTWLGALLAAILPALIDGFLGRRLNAEEEARRDDTNKDLGAAEAGNETLTTIGAITAERADLPAMPYDDAALARRMRDRAERNRAAERGASASDIGNKPGAG